MITGTSQADCAILIIAAGTGELWARSCKICRIREGVDRRHDWRVCTVYPNDCETVGRVHLEVQAGMGMIENAGQMNGICKNCMRMKQGCWMQLKDGVQDKRCRYHGVVTESVAGGGRSVSTRCNTSDRLMTTLYRVTLIRLFVIGTNCALSSEIGRRGEV